MKKTLISATLLFLLMISSVYALGNKPTDMSKTAKQSDKIGSSKIITTSISGQIGIIMTHGETLYSEDLKNYYTSLGYAVVDIVTTFTFNDLIGLEILVVGEGGLAWTDSEIQAVQAFVASGKDFVAIGDQLSASVQTILNAYGISYTGVPGSMGSSTYLDGFHPIMQGVVSINAPAPVDSLNTASPAYPIAWDAANTHMLIAGREAGGHVLCLCDDFAGSSSILYADDNEIMFANIAEWMCGRGYVVFEEAHSSSQTIAGGYSGFADYLKANDYMVSTINPGAIIDGDALALVDVLIIVAPSTSYTASEIAAIETWVKGGGRLLLISDWDNYGIEINTIASRFGVKLRLDAVEDSDENVVATYWPYYTGANIRPHPATTGVTRVEMYLGDGILSAPAAETPLIVTDTDGTATWYYDSSLARAVSVMSVIDGGTAGSGCVAIIGDCNIWVSSTDTDGDGTANFYDSDHEVLALNIIDWLALPNILIVNDNDGGALVAGTSLTEFASALAEADIDYTVWHESLMGNPSLDYLLKFQLVIWTCGDYWNEAVDPSDAVTLQSYLDQGGNILLEGEDIGYDHLRDSFMMNVAHAIEWADSAGAPGLTVTNPVHPVTLGLPASFTWSTWPSYPDGVSPVNGAFGVLGYTGKDYTAVTVFDGITTGSVVYYAFPLRNLQPPEIKTLTINSVKWLLGAPTILAYVEYTDYDEEYANSLAAIDSTYGHNYLLTEFWDYTQLDSLLPGKDILLVPEQENGDLATMQAIGASWSASLTNFLARGGIIIVCDFYWSTGSSYGILTGAGLMSITSANSVTGFTVYVADSADPLAEGVSSSFTAPSGTLRFVTAETNVVINDGTYPVVIHKTVGLGQIALIGFDYFSSNPDVDQILGNAVGLRRHAPVVLAYVEYTDYDQEYAHSLAAIDSTYGHNYLLTEFWDYTQLDSLLPGKDILLVPEQENGGLATMQAIGASWSASLTNFLARGGIIIVCDYTGGSHGILTGAGLMSITSINYIPYSTVYLVDPADRLAEGVSSSFTAPDGSLSFVTSETNVVVNDGTYPVVIHKTVGLGQIALIGFDYFSSNPDVDQILGNAITLWPYAPSPVKYVTMLTGVTAWYWTGNTIIYSVVAGDVDGDGSMETVTGGYYYDGTRDVAQLCVWDGATLALENVKTWYWAQSTTINSVAVGDVDADGYIEIVTGGGYSDGTRLVAQLCVWDGATLALENVKVWYWTSNTYIHSVAVGDVDADGTAEIVTGGYYYDGTRENAQLCVWAGATLALENVKCWYWTGDTRINSVAVGDVDADGFVEIVTGGYYIGGVAGYNAQLCVWSGSTLGLESVKAWYWTYITLIYSVAVGDVDGDGSVEIVTGGVHMDAPYRTIAQLCVWDGSTLALEGVRTWYWTSPPNAYIYSVALGDVDGDGSTEILTGGVDRSTAQLCVWDGQTLGLENVKTWYWTGDTPIFSVAVCDANNGGLDEIVTGGAYYDLTRYRAQLATWRITAAP